MTEKQRLEFTFDVKPDEYIKIEFSSEIEIHYEYVESDSNGFITPVTDDEVEDWRVTRTVEVTGKPNSTVRIFFESGETVRDIQYDVNEVGFVQWVGQGTFIKNAEEQS